MKTIQEIINYIRFLRTYNRYDKETTLNKIIKELEEFQKGE